MTDLHVVTRDGTEPALLWGHGLLQSIPTSPIDPLALEVENAVVAYDARNHGSSPDATESDQLTWPALAGDMLAVADHAGHGRFVAGGASMGAATALTAALRAPDRTVALVLAIPPTAWGLRWGQRAIYGTLGALGSVAPVPGIRRGARSLRGASQTDLPSLDEIATVTAPTLVLTWPFDPSHPRVVARRIAEAIEGSTLVESSRPGDNEGWHQAVETFLRGL